MIGRTDMTHVLQEDDELINLGWRVLDNIHKSVLHRGVDGRPLEGRRSFKKSLTCAMAFSELCPEHMKGTLQLSRIQAIPSKSSVNGKILNIQDAYTTLAQLEAYETLEFLITWRSVGPLTENTYWRRECTRKSCSTCASNKKKCEWTSGSDTCVRCASKGLTCKGPAAVQRSMEGNSTGKRKTTALDTTLQRTAQVQRLIPADWDCRTLGTLAKRISEGLDTARLFRSLMMLARMHSMTPTNWKYAPLLDIICDAAGIADWKVITDFAKEKVEIPSHELYDAPLPPSTYLDRMGDKTAIKWCDNGNDGFIQTNKGFENLFPALQQRINTWNTSLGKPFPSGLICRFGSIGIKMSSSPLIKITDEKGNQILCRMEFGYLPLALNNVPSYVMYTPIETSRSTDIPSDEEAKSKAAYDIPPPDIPLFPPEDPFKLPELFGDNDT